LICELYVGEPLRWKGFPAVTQVALGNAHPTDTYVCSIIESDYYMQQKQSLRCSRNALHGKSKHFCNWLYSNAV